MTQSLLKSPDHSFLHDNPKMHKFSEQTLLVGEESKIPVFDFSQLAKHVHSFDGTHYNVPVNIMKIKYFYIMCSLCSELSYLSSEAW